MRATREWTEVSPIGDLLIRSATYFGDRKAVDFIDASTTYDELLSGARSIAASLIASGIGYRDHVGLMATNGVPFLHGIFGALLAGCVIVPINVRHKSREVGHIVRNGRLKAILATASDDEYVNFTEVLSEAVSGLAEAADPMNLSLPEAPDLRVAALLAGGDRAGFADAEAFLAVGCSVDPAMIEDRRLAVNVRDLAMILYTSGTTADPKGCLLTHEALSRGTVERADTRFRVGDHDVHWNAGPLFHIAALGPLVGCIGVGNTFLSDTFYDPVRAVAQMQREGVTMAWPWFPALVQGLMDQEAFSAKALPQLRKIMMIGPVSLAEKVAARFPGADLMQACGMTETSGIFALSKADDTFEERTMTQGKMAPGMSCRIVNPETGQDCDDGQVGEIWVRGYCVTEGYYRAPEKTAEAMTPDGWFKTGDMYERTAEGNLIFFGRYKDMLKVGGENVAAIEIEAFLCSYPGVRSVEVVSKPDPRLDEVPVAFVELMANAEVSAESLIDYCKGRIARYKIPVEVRFMAPGAWPMSATKVDKRALRQLLT